MRRRGLGGQRKALHYKGLRSKDYTHLADFEPEVHVDSEEGEQGEQGEKERGDSEALTFGGVNVARQWMSKCMCAPSDALIGRPKW